MAPRFDPYAILAALERQHIGYVIIGAFGRVIQGADEITRGIDITPSTRPENLRRLDLALHEIDVRLEDGDKPSVQTTDFEVEPVLALLSDPGEIKVVPFPSGTRGYDDLRRAASREPIGHGLRPSVASPGDLARMLSALGREQDRPHLRAMRRLMELDRGWTIER